MKNVTKERRNAYSTLTVCVILMFFCIISIKTIYASQIDETVVKDVKCESVTSNIVSGRVTAGRMLRLACVEPSAVIYYTTDGTMPDRNGKVYTQLIELNDSLKKDGLIEIRAVAYVINGDEVRHSDVSEFTYRLERCQSDIYETTDNSFAGAAVVSIPGRYSGTLYNTDDIDYYSFNISNSVKLDASLDFPGNTCYGIALCNSEKKVIASTELSFRQQLDYAVTPGNYYIMVYSIEGFSDEEKYTLTLRDNSAGSSPSYSGIDAPDLEYEYKSDDIKCNIDMAVNLFTQNTRQRVDNIEVLPEASAVSPDVFSVNIKNAVYSYGAVTAALKSDKDMVFTSVIGWNNDGFICSNHDIDLAVDNGYRVIPFTAMYQMTEGSPFAMTADSNLMTSGRTYINDVLGATGTIEVSGLCGISNVYKTGNIPETVNEVSFVTCNENMYYYVDICANGTVTRVASGCEKNDGYHTVRLDKELALAAGTDYEVIVWYKGNGIYSLPYSADNNAGYKMKPAKGLSYVITADGRKDISAEGKYACVRVYSHSESVTNEVVKRDVEKTDTAINITDENKGYLSNVIIDKGNQDNGNVNDSFAYGLPSSYDLRNIATLPPVIKHKQLNNNYSVVYAAAASMDAYIIRHNAQIFAQPQRITLSDNQVNAVVSSTKGMDIKLTATLLPDNSDDKMLIWSVSGDTDSVTLKKTSDFSGKQVTVCRAKKKGKVTISVKSRSNPSVCASCDVTITRSDAEAISENTLKLVTSISLNNKTVVLKRGKTKKLMASVKPLSATNKTVTWKSSNRKVARVSKTGVITAKSGGTCYVYAINELSGVQARCKITVGYRIKYILKGGKNNKKNSHSFTKKHKVALHNAKKDGYKFCGWYSNKKCTKRVKTIKRGTSKNITLYAKWKKK